jgi:DNA-binding transcriptional LysR family regulator
MLSQLNLNHLKVFQAVYEQKSMTKAAQKIFLTQSGVSQHIKNLEETLNISLFDRVGKALIPTRIAQDLYGQCKNSLDLLQKTLNDLSCQQPMGAISLSAPPEFASDILSPMLADLQQKYPLIIIYLYIGHASQMLKNMLSGEHDLAFLDNFSTDSRLQSRIIFNETIILCAHNSLIKKYPQCREDNFLNPDLPLLAYMPGELIFDAWYRHHFHKSPSKLKIVAYLSNSQIISHMICSGAGAGIISGHHFAKLREQGHDLRAIEPNKIPLINPISMNTVKNRSISSIERIVADFFLEKFDSADFLS